MSKLLVATQTLKRFIESIGASTVPTALLSPRQNAIIEPPLGVAGLLSSLIIDASRGSKLARDMIKMLTDYKASSSETDAIDAEVKKLIKFYVDGNQLDDKATMANIVGHQGSKNLAIIQTDSIRITPTGRNVDAITVMLNSIPTLEIERCVPYLNIEVQVPRGPISPDGKAQGLSLMRAIGGPNVVKTPTDKRLLLSLGGKNEFGDTTTSGMELFTSPQVLTDPSERDSGRATAVIDPFRPFMSIEKFTVEINPQLGFFSYRVANLDLTLHDRSRLAEIADFIHPTLFEGDNTVKLYIEYGWSHPDTSDDNVYASFLNSMRMREKYGVVNSSFTFTPTGEVKLKLRLYAYGAIELQTLTIGENQKVRDSFREVKQLQALMTKIIAQHNEQVGKGLKEIRGEQQFFSTAQDLATALELTPALLDAFKKFKANTSNAKGDLKVIRDEIIKLHGANGKGGDVVTKLNQNVAAQINTEMQKLKKAKSESDPFLVSAQKKLNSLAARAPINDEAFQLGSNRFVSFGKLMALFVGKPLASLGKHEEVQLVFYPFNFKAAAAAELNIAEFPILISDFESMLTFLGRQKGFDIQLVEFIKGIINNFIDDMTNIGYGLSQGFKTKIDSQTGTRVKVISPSKNKKTFDEGVDNTSFDQLQKRLTALGVPDGMFRMPQVDVYIEAVPVDGAQTGNVESNGTEKTILRLHFFDKVATAYESPGQLILATREGDLRSLGQRVRQTPANDHTQVFNHYIDRGIDAGVIKRVLPKNEGAEKVYDITYDSERLRAFLRKTLPTIVYGENATAVKRADFSTMLDPKLASINMRRAGEVGPLTPSGLTPTNLPLKSLPAKIRLELLGCPLISYMQQFFIDFSTNTTADNIYAVNTMSHEISPGRFDTSVDLLVLDTYGRFETLGNQVATMITKLKEVEEQASQRKKR